MRRSICCLVLLLAAGCSSPGFLPEEAPIPEGLETDSFRVRPITVVDAEKDYEAVMESIDIIHRRFMDDSWPTKEFTLEENRRDMGRKERRRARRQSFTYTVVSLDESRVLGCVYVNEGIGGPDAAVFLWVRQSEVDGPLDQELEAAVRNWMKEAWPFERVVYPGRVP